MKYLAVRKFVKKSIKSLSTLSSEFSEKLGSMFWIAEVRRDGIRGNNEGVMDDDMRIVGCIGLKATISPVNWSQPAPDSMQPVNDATMAEGSDRGSGGLHSTTDTQEHRGEISHMCVAESHRGKGLARELLDLLLRHATYASASCHDYDRMQSVALTYDHCNGMQSRFRTLDLTVLCDLTAAKSLYLSEGFTDQGPPSDLGHGCFLQHMSLSQPSVYT